MEEIYSLIQCLTSREWESLRNYLTCFSTHDEGGLKQLQLAKILREANECPDENRCSLLVYGAKDEVGFDMLKSRLKEKTLDFLLTDISCDKKQELDEMDLAIIRMKKKSAQFFQLYYSKSRNAVFYSLLDEIILMAKEYEQYNILLEHLKFKKAFHGSRNGSVEFYIVEREIQEYNKRMQLSNKADHYYYELIIKNDYIGRPDEKEKMILIRDRIVELKEENAKINSAVVKHNTYFLELEYYHLRKDYKEARSKCLEWLDIVRNNKSVYRRQRVGVVYDNLSRCEYYLMHFDKAAEAAQHAQEHFNLNSENYCIAIEQEFYAEFAQKNYARAEMLAQKMRRSASRKELGEFRYAKYNFLWANALFKLKRFIEALNILSQELEISKDKTGWEIGLRTLKIMTLIELEKFSEAELATLAMREFFKYTDRKIEEENEKRKQQEEKTGQPDTPFISERDRMILNLLMQAERKGFMFELLNGKAEENISKLAHNAALQWESFTHEVIPFHAWFAEKLSIRKVKKKVFIPIKEKVKVK